MPRLTIKHGQEQWELLPGEEAEVDEVFKRDDERALKCGSDRTRAEEAIDALYNVAGLAPVPVKWIESPPAAIEALLVPYSGRGGRNAVVEKLYDSFREAWVKTWPIIIDEDLKRGTSYPYQGPGDHLHEVVLAQTFTRFRDLWASTFGSTLTSAAPPELASLAPPRLDQLCKQATKPFEKRIRSLFGSAATGLKDDSNLRLLDLFNRFDKRFSADIEPLLILDEETSYCWMTKEISIAVENPSRLETDKDLRPHSETGPAVVFGGEEINCHHGDLVPAEEAVTVP